MIIAFHRVLYLGIRSCSQLLSAQTGEEEQGMQ